MCEKLVSICTWYLTVTLGANRPDSLHIASDHFFINSESSISFWYFVIISFVTGCTISLHNFSKSISGAKFKSSCCIASRSIAGDMPHLLFIKLSCTLLSALVSNIEFPKTWYSASLPMLAAVSGCWNQLPRS